MNTVTKDDCVFHTQSSFVTVFIANAVSHNKLSLGIKTSDQTAALVIQNLCQAKNTDRRQAIEAKRYAS